MSESFKKLKKQIYREHLIKTIILGVAIGLSVFGVLFLLNKREKIDFKIWQIILISLGSLLLTSGLYFFVRKPSNKKIAKRLDKTFSLNEKVQTMLDFKDEQENEIVLLQRKDTDNLLKSIKPSNLRFSFNIIILILLFIGIGLTITSVSVPGIVHNSNPPVDPPIEVAETDIDKIKKLIKHVEASKIYDDMKVAYIGELNLLITELQSDGLTNDMLDTYVNATINNVLYYMTNKNINLNYGKYIYDVDEVFYTPRLDVVSLDPARIGIWKCESDTKKEIKITSDKITYLGTAYEADIDNITSTEIVGKLNDETITLTLNKDTESKLYGKLIDEEGTVYTKYEDFYRIRALGEGIYNYSISDIEQVIKNINDEFTSKKSGSTFLLMDKLDLDIAVYDKMLEEKEPKEGTKADDIYNAFVKLKTELDKASIASDKDKLGIITNAYNALYVDLSAVLPDMLANRNEAWYIEDTLRDIFGLGPAIREKDLSHGGGNTGDAEGEGKEDFGSGGLGDGEYKFAAKDFFFDYDTGKWMAYGVFYYDYYAVIDSLIQDGTLSEEMAQYVKDYFNKLLNGLDQDNE